MNFRSDVLQEEYVHTNQLGHKRMMTTDEHYNDRDMVDLKKAAELVESPFILGLPPRFVQGPK
jgi:hypothetical protein